MSLVDFLSHAGLPSCQVTSSRAIGSLVTCLSEVPVDYLLVWSGSPYHHIADPASTLESFLVCSSVGTSSICVAVGTSGKFESCFLK